MDESTGQTKPEELLRRLIADGEHPERYRTGPELGRGGMGKVLEVRDVLLDRTLAMKMALNAGGTDPLASRHLGRFLDEARITSQLDHPGIVPVHDLGVSDDGTPYYTMKRVRGRTLRQVMSDGDWSTARVVSVLLSVCEAMSYAHAKGVIHRDLKPANIMVGRFGEVHVMDWGLVRVMADAAEPGISGAESARTEPVDQSLRTPDSSLATAEGDTLGTPAYMAPEQAWGRLAELGPTTDVYAIGAMLYRLLAGAPPYMASGEIRDNRPVHERVKERPPLSVSQTAPDAPGELVAICEQAMARNPQERFADMGAMADQLRAWLEGRPVSAHRTGAWVEMTKWCRRNRAAAAALAALVIVAATSGWIIASSEHRARVAAAERAALEQRELMLHRAEELVQQGDNSWPVHPDHVPAMDDWLARAETTSQLITSSQDGRQSALAALGARGTQLNNGTQDDRALSGLASQLERLRELEARKRAELEAGDLDDKTAAHTTASVHELAGHIPALEAQLAIRQRLARSRATWQFDDPEDAAEHHILRRLALAAAQLSPRGEVRRSVEQRRQQSLDLLDVDSARWNEAIASIADSAQCPRYDGMLITPQMGLQPLRRNPDTQLWEFLHTSSGEPPTLDEDGRWVVGADTGVVFVLIPAGSTWLGSQNKDPSAPAFDPFSQVQDGHPLEASVEAFFIAAHEFTQGQWARLAGDWPATQFVGSYAYVGDPIYQQDWPVTPAHPVETVSWDRVMDHLPRWGLTLPTEAQWTAAADADRGRPYPFFDGDNLKLPNADAERTVLRHANTNWEHVVSGEVAANPGHPALAALIELTDGFIVHGPVGSLLPNANGLYDVAGNVCEWCLDWHATDFTERKLKGVRQGTGELVAVEQHLKPWRGGSFDQRPLEDMRTAARHGDLPVVGVRDRGFRAARPLQDEPVH
ncbi:MAG: sulfatase activating formylglycine-generating enzyme [Pseudohongiellaceae bacterium]|jgi:formylglycine-generating enzyme required for sulfatase activity